VPLNAGSINVTAVANNNSAQVEINGTKAAGSLTKNIVLSPDGNTISVKVTAQDGITQNTYAMALKTIWLKSSVKNGVIYTGGRITLSPSISGGSWSYDSEYLSRSANTFKALKAGTTRVTYTLDDLIVNYDITINQSSLPQTGQNYTAA